jgi:hypothetical protein
MSTAAGRLEGRGEEGQDRATAPGSKPHWPMGRGGEGGHARTGWDTLEKRMDPPPSPCPRLGIPLPHSHTHTPHCVPTLRPGQLCERKLEVDCM